MTNGWYHTAKTHKKLGVDFGVTVSAVFVPTSDNYFTPNNSSTLTFANNTHPSLQMAPTIMGPKDQTTYSATYTPQGSSTPITVGFNGPEGLDMKGNLGVSAIPVPMAQLGIGLIKNTDLKLRMVPTINNGGNSISMFGVGLMHDIKQYLPGVKELPFDLSVIAGYNSLKGASSLASSSTSPTSTDGKISYTFNSWVGQVLISKKLAILTLYAGVGYGSVSTKVNITGTYTISPTTGGNFNITDPLAYTLNNTGAKLTGGMRIKLGPIYFNGDYTVQKYSAFTFGLGASIR